MRYETIPHIKEPLSKIVFGCAIPSMIAGESVDELLDEVYNLGITTFDTAENYGLSEVSLGRWMQRRKNRTHLVLISKGCHPYDGKDRVTPECLRQDIEQSFSRLGTDYIDLYLLHRDNINLSPGPMVEVLNEYYKAGRIGAFGGSNWTHTRIQEANAYAASHGLVPFTITSPNFGLCDQLEDPFGGGSGCVTISGSANAPAREWYAKQHMPIFAYSSLGRGMFSGRVKSDDPEGAKHILDPYAVKGYCYPENFNRLARAEQLAKERHLTVPQIALAWILHQKLDVFPIISSSNGTRMQNNLKALDVQLSEEEVKWLNLENE